MLNLIKDLKNFLRYKKIEKKYSVGFFCESKFIYNYIIPYIKRQNKKRKVVLISFEEILNEQNQNFQIFTFKTNFFRELVFLTLNLKFLYSSTPDLNNTIFKKSKIVNCKYIYLQHSPVSLNLIYNENAFDAFDAIQVISEFQYKEMQEIKSKKNLNLKIFKSKYLFIKKQKMKIDNMQKTDVLIAPSWNTKFYEFKCHIDLIKNLKEKSISFKFRPHPMSLKKNEISNDFFKINKIEVDNSEYVNFNNYNFLISDWSGIFIEYSLLTCKKAYLINTKKKLNNIKFDKFVNKPIEITLRNTFAHIFAIKDIPLLVNKLNEFKSILNTNLDYKDEKIESLISKNFY